MMSLFLLSLFMATIHALADYPTYIEIEDVGNSTCPDGYAHIKQDECGTYALVEHIHPRFWSGTMGPDYHKMLNDCIKIAVNKPLVTKTFSIGTESKKNTQLICKRDPALVKFEDGEGSCWWKKKNGEYGAYTSVTEKQCVEYAKEQGEDVRFASGPNRPHGCYRLGNRRYYWNSRGYCGFSTCSWPGPDGLKRPYADCNCGEQVKSCASEFTGVKPYIYEKSEDIGTMTKEECKEKCLNRSEGKIWNAATWNGWQQYGICSCSKNMEGVEYDTPGSSGFVTFARPWISQADKKYMNDNKGGYNSIEGVCNIKN